MCCFWVPPSSSLCGALLCTMVEEEEDENHHHQDWWWWRRAKWDPNPTKKIKFFQHSPPLQNPLFLSKIHSSTALQLPHWSCSWATITIFKLQQQVRPMAEEAICGRKHGGFPKISLHDYRGNKGGFGVWRWGFQEQEAFQKQKQFEWSAPDFGDPILNPSCFPTLLHPTINPIILWPSLSAELGVGERCRVQ